MASLKVLDEAETSLCLGLRSGLVDIGVFPILTVCDHTIDRKCSLFESAFIRPHRRCMSFSLVSCHTGKESIDCFVVRPVRKGRPSITWVLRYRYPSSCLLFHPHESRPSNAGDLSIVVATKLTRGSATSKSSRTTWYLIGKLVPKYIEKGV